MTELKIDPKFRDLIPKLTDDEFMQLEKNILADGRVKEPIVVWNGTIIDGHHRYYIVQKHPEIPYEIEEREFANEYEAMAWACSNQLGRRNLTENDIAYLRGKQYDSQKTAESFHRNQYVSGKDGGHENGTTKKTGRTADQLAEKLGVTRGTICRNDQYARGVDIAEEIIPGLKDEILHGNLNVPKNIIQELPKQTPDIQRKAVISISDGDIDSAKRILNQADLKISGLHDADETIEYTIDDLIGEIRANFRQYMTNIESTLKDHPDVLSQPDCRQMVVFELMRIFNEEKEKIWRI